MFVTLDGPSGVGKSTTCAALCTHLRDEGIAVRSTAEPTATELGAFIRAHTDTYSGLALACLVAGDRHHHLSSEIEPAIRAGELVLCDRYLPSSLVLQVQDGVPRDLVWQLHPALRVPDLAVILTGDPDVLSRRLLHRGDRDRFERDLAGSEVRLFHDAAAHLAARGWPIYELDCSDLTPNRVVDALLRRIRSIRAHRSDGRAG